MLLIVLGVGDGATKVRERGREGGREREIEREREREKKREKERERKGNKNNAALRPGRRRRCDQGPPEPAHIRFGSLVSSPERDEEEIAAVCPRC